MLYEYIGRVLQKKRSDHGAHQNSKYIPHLQHGTKWFSESVCTICLLYVRIDCYFPYWYELSNPVGWYVTNLV